MCLTVQCFFTICCFFLFIIEELTVFFIVTVKMELFVRQKTTIFCQTLLFCIINFSSPNIAADINLLNLNSRLCFWAPGFRKLYQILNKEYDLSLTVPLSFHFFANFSTKSRFSFYLVLI